jgi:hypothetical protein
MTAPAPGRRLRSRLAENRAARAAEDEILTAAAGAARTELHPRPVRNLVAGAPKVQRQVTRDEACRRAGLILAAALAEAAETQRTAQVVAA